MDMLEVGNGMTEAEDRAHFSIWAMLASPLIAGNDLRTMNENTRKILTNKDIIAINQDKLGVQALKFIDEGDIEVWVKALANNEWAFMFLNRADSTKRYDYKWAEHEIKDDVSKHELDFKKSKFNWRDLWDNTKGSTAKNVALSIPAHSVVVLRLTPQ
jgi:alpha-galactosidase